MVILLRPGAGEGKGLPGLITITAGSLSIIFPSPWSLNFEKLQCWRLLLEVEGEGCPGAAEPHGAQARSQPSHTFLLAPVLLPLQKAPAPHTAQAPGHTVSLSPAERLGLLRTVPPATARQGAWPAPITQQSGSWSKPALQVLFCPCFCTLPGLGGGG